MKQINTDSNKSKVNNSKAIETHDKESIKALFSRIRDIFRLIFLKYSFVKRLVSLTVIFALLMPFVLLGNFSFVSAQSISPSSLIGNISTPSFAYDFGIDKSLNFSPALAMQNSTAAVSAYVTAPTLPKGFESASPVSPLYRDFSSVSASAFSTVGSFFGFFVNPIVSEESESAELSESSELSENTVSDGAFPNGAKPFDLNGDGKANVSSWNPSNGEWKTMDNSGNLLASETLGNSSSLVIPGDFDNDNITDKAVWTNGLWTIKKSSDGTTVTHSFGTSGDIPVAGDYDGDGKSDYAVFRPSTNTWWIQQSSNNAITSTGFGASGDIPIQGDYDGDNETDIAIFRPSTGDWHISASTAGYYAFHWGLNGDTPIPADFNNDNKTDYGIYRPTTGTWYIYYSDGTTPYTAETWGNYGDQPVAADYDGDGKADLSVWRPKTGLWLIKLSNTGTYRYETLGINSDTPIPAAYVQKIGYEVPEYEMLQLRLEPKNATGGTNLYSRNFGWETGLVGLSGRAGLNAGFGISYNSLIWIKDETNNSIHFDPDYSNVTPGFKIGFPTIEPAYYDKPSAKFSYLMMTPSGGRVEFKQTAASDTYESIDSSYTQLKLDTPTGPNAPVDSIGITMTTTDGTTTSFEYKAGLYVVKEIKDRNGNYITVNHDDYGLLKTVTDTLGRVITVNYDAEFYPTTITQDWKTNNGAGSTTTHTYATLSYKTTPMNATFDTPNLTVYGQTSGSIKVLDKITFADGSSTRFDYNGYGQVEKVYNYAADGTTKLNSIATNLDSVTGTQTDVPRLSQQRSYVKDFNNGNEVIVDNTLSATTTTPSIPGESSESAKLIQIKMQNNPYNAATNIYVGDSGWKEGLPILTEDYIDVVGSSFLRKRWSFTKWEQDDETLIYAENPRTIRTKVGDDENSSVIRTEIDYLTTGALADFNLQKEIKLYDNTTNALQKRTKTTYEDSSAYISKRIIGLPSKVESFGYDQGTSQEEQISEIDYAYDEEDFTKETNQNITPIQHDTTNFGTSFIIGRGNLTSLTRHNTAPNSTDTTVSKVRYDIAGSVVAGINPSGNKIKTDYADVFTDGTTGTYAYPTTLTDPNGKSSTVKYRFDIGANVEATSPAPEGQTVGKVTKRVYRDTDGDLVRDSIDKSGTEHFYTRYEYPTNDLEVATYSVLVSGQGEVEARTYADGAGRTLRSKKEMPGSTNGWSGTKNEYDILGRVTKSFIPVEVNPSGLNWSAVGNDANNWLWTEKEYDWRSRVTKETNTDGTFKEYTYNGCGCAGGMEITIKGEEITETDWSGNNTTSTLGKRIQKVYQDVLGRTYKTQVMKWDGTTPYTTSVTEFNGRDQALTVTKYDGTDNVNNDHRIAKLTYDGYGRTKTRQTTMMDSGTSVTYNYNDDDSILSMTDARGVVTSYAYNNRGLTTSVSFTVPDDPNNPGTPDPSIPELDSITFDYDDIGNIKEMNDSLGTVTYEYTELSQLKSEKRDFDDALADEPTSGKYAIDYTYTLSGQLKSITAPFGETFNYTHDKVGRLTNVAGATAFKGITNYASNPTYNARGTLTSLQYGNGTEMTVTGFNDKLQATGFELKKGTSIYVQKDYKFYEDGSLKFIDDGLLDKFDRSYKYDFTGRTIEGNAGTAARNETSTEMQNTDRPYEIDYSYNAFDNLTDSS